MKPDIYLLIIDDDSQRKEIGKIELGLKGSHNVHSFNLRTSAPEFRIEGSNDADFEKIKIGITKLFNEVGHFHLVLTDFGLNASFDGLDVVEFLRKNWDTVPIMLYSGLISDVVKRILNTTASQLNKEQIVSAISELFNYHIVDCVPRLDYVNKAINYLRKDREISFRTTLICLLYGHGDIVFNSCFPEFKGKKFREIAEIIERKSDQRSDEWAKAMLEQTLAYLVKINE